jgi:hypothetical protein
MQSPTQISVFLEIFLAALSSLFFESSASPRFLAQDNRLFPGNMAATFGLPDDEIDRLLSEAEARLSGNGTSDAVAVAAVPTAKSTAIIAAPVAPVAGEQTTVSEQKPEKLSVRVPQLHQKQKVRACSTHSRPHVFNDEDQSQICMTLARSRHGLRTGTIMISLYHSYSD